MKERIKFLLIVGIFLAADYIPWSHPAIWQSELEAFMMKIAGYGVFGTPAVVVGGEVKSESKIPKKEDVLAWIR